MIRILIIVLSLLGLLELSSRVSGVGDFPLYVRSSAIGYYLKPDQQGVFLNKNHWYVNKDGLNNNQPFTLQHPYTLLVGDSVVYGGNPVDYGDRIGTITRLASKQNVWVAAVGGWSLFNELAYLSTKQDIVKNADHLFIVYDSGDLDGLTLWQGELTHPTHRPLLWSWYAVRRYLLPHASELPPIPEETSSGTGAWKTRLDELLSAYHGKVIFVLYPDQKGLLDSNLWTSQTRDIRRYVESHAQRIAIVDVAQQKGWNVSMYRDGIHPNIEGDKFIGKLLSQSITN